VDGLVAAVNGQSRVMSGRTPMSTSGCDRRVIEVPEALRGQHLGHELIELALHVGNAAGLRIVAVCPFVRDYMKTSAGRPTTLMRVTGIS
jgi:predicted GNAT family acetyltransferase